MAENNYYEQQRQKNTKKYRELLGELPRFCAEYFRAFEYQTSALTRLNYAYDLRVFFGYLKSEAPAFADVAISDITCEMLDALTLTDFEIYIEYLGNYYTGETEHINREKAIARKVASLRSFIKYYYKKGALQNNVPALLDTPKLHEKSKIYLLPEEVSAMIDAIETGENLTERQQKLHERTKKRDMAIVILFLTTGIRVSELVGLNIRDIDLENMTFKVVRKGGNEAMLYFSFETTDALSDYLCEREEKGLAEPDMPLFLSGQGKRINVRSVENLVKKYARTAAPLKKISPHKLRSTYGSSLYEETGDIYLVAEVLGHKDVNTTKKHYAAMSEEHRRRAANAVKVRPDTK